MSEFSIRPVGGKIPFAISVVRRRGKYLRLTVESAEKVELALPRWASRREALDFLQEKEAWLHKALARKKIQQKNWFSFHGKEYALHLVTSKQSEKVEFHEGEVWITAPNEAEARKYFQEFLKREAEQVLPLELEEFSQRCDLSYRRLTIRSQKTRWGSCSADKSISLNIALMRLKAEVRHYVILHELCHTREMNHSRKFWALLATHCPEYKRLKKTLAEYGLLQLF